MARAAEMKFVGAGIEMAMWDILGKALDKPLYRLLGGANDTFVPFVAYVFYRYEKNGLGGESRPDDIVRRYGELVDEYGFTGIKFKGGVFPPDQELAAVRALRETYGEQIRFFRFDPNQAWTVETSIRFINKMEAYDLEYIEDPTWDLEGMSLVRRGVRVPLATNQAVISLPLLAPAVRMRAIDVLLVDLYFLGRDLPGQESGCHLRGPSTSDWPSTATGNSASERRRASICGPRRPCSLTTTTRTTTIRSATSLRSPSDSETKGCRFQRGPDWAWSWIPTVLITMPGSTRSEGRMSSSSTPSTGPDGRLICPCGKTPFQVRNRHL